MRFAALIIASALAVACSKEPPTGEPPAEEPAAPKPAVDAPHQADAAAGGLPQRHRTFSSARAALEAIMGESNPTVLGIGESHAQKGGPAVKSSLEVFADEWLPVLAAAKATDLVLETWVEDPTCSRKAEAVRSEVKANLSRPPETESLLLSTMRRAKAAGIRNHGLVMKCDHYETLRTESGEVDYAELLSRVTRGLRGRARELLARDDTGLIVLYGGALHNDLYPKVGVEEWSYAAALGQTTPRYVEVDLLVPELIENVGRYKMEPWFDLVRAAGDEVQLIARGERSYVVILRRGVVQPSKAPPARATLPK